MSKRYLLNCEVVWAVLVCLPRNQTGLPFHVSDRQECFDDIFGWIIFKYKSTGLSFTEESEESFLMNCWSWLMYAMQSISSSVRKILIRLNFGYERRKNFKPLKPLNAFRLKKLFLHFGEKAYWDPHMGVYGDPYFKFGGGGADRKFFYTDLQDWKHVEDILIGSFPIPMLGSDEVVTFFRFYRDFGYYLSDPEIPEPLPERGDYL